MNFIRANIFVSVVLEIATIATGIQILIDRFPGDIGQIPEYMQTLLIACAVEFIFWSLYALAYFVTNEMGTKTRRGYMHYDKSIGWVDEEGRRF